ncbi:RrF2 family transcriptional regulator [Caproiciproducens faecalis]|uniref:Rrf2 family transcriptional regulator n=1 Tax=Caproiciproducens faecalis TaxID=2820301 RepID=A0ABS7DK67_9FIRM|nr:Rrf2 family transcriptional regulator [Caproiciproducens faecalis]MBW7571472.1 Rrf2 family transcriptional regulator [Caproiciproducens faecalis]
MRISSKGRYGLAAMITMSQNYNANECITIVSISEKLGISKIYLEQVFSLLKRAELVIAVKGAQGGYKLAMPPQKINVYEILRALEQSLFEKTEESVEKKAPVMEQSMQQCVFSVIDAAIEAELKKISLYDIADDVDKRTQEAGFMFYI